MSYYKTTKEFLLNQLKNPNIEKQLASKYMDILKWIQEKEEKEKQFTEITVEQLYEVGTRLHKKFQSSLETKVK